MHVIFLYCTLEFSENTEDEQVEEKEEDENKYYTLSEMEIKVNDFYDRYNFQPYLS